MGTMTLADFRDDLGGALGRDITSRFDRWVRQALLEVGSVFKFPEFEAVSQIDTEVGINVYAGPGNYRALHESGLWIVAPADNKAKLIPETRTEYMKRLEVDTGDGSTYGAPRYYHIYQREVWLRPVPDATYTISLNYWQNIEGLVNDTDKSPLPDDWDDIIFTGALYRGLRFYGEFDRYQNVRNDFLAMVRSRVMQTELEEFPEGGINIAYSEDDLINE